MNATGILQNMIILMSWEWAKLKRIFPDMFYEFAIATLQEAKERISKLPPTISQEDIEKLQRYYYQKHWMVLEYDNSRTDWLYIRYDDIISLLK